MTLELRLSYADVSIKKASYKGDLIGLGGPKSLKIIFTLLTEVIVVHVRFTIIYICYLSFEGLFALLCKLVRSLIGL